MPCGVQGLQEDAGDQPRERHCPGAALQLFWLVAAGLERAAKAVRHGGQAWRWRVRMSCPTSGALVVYCTSGIGANVRVS